MTTRPVQHTGPPDAPPPAQRGAPEATGDPFAAILESTQARTATPEGQPDGIADCDPAPTETQADVPVVAGAVPAPMPTVPASIVPAAPVAAMAAAPVPVAVTEPVPSVPVVPAPVAPVAPPAAPEQAAPVVPAGVTVPAAPAIETGGPAKPVAEEPPPATPVARPLAPEHAAPRSATPEDPADTPTTSVAEPVRPTEPKAAERAPAAAPATQHAQPATTAQLAPAHAAPPVHHVDRAEPVTAPHAARAAQTVELAIRLAAHRGASQATLQLRPAELGGVEIHLRHSAEGIAARVTAEAPEAAHLLTQAAAELRRSLEDQGMTVLRLDVQVASSDTRTSGGGAAGEGHDGPRNSSADHHDAEPEAEAPVERVALSTGVLVDLKA